VKSGRLATFINLIAICENHRRARSDDGNVPVMAIGPEPFFPISSLSTLPRRRFRQANFYLVRDRVRTALFFRIILP
jgi:hypothetical protein